MTAVTRRASRKDASPAGGWVDALAAILRGTASLPGAACSGDARFTSDDADDQAAVIQICATCPELSRCRDWVESLPRSRIPPGVTAGQLHQPPTRRKKATP